MRIPLTGLEIPTWLFKFFDDLIMGGIYTLSGGNANLFLIFTKTIRIGLP
jgi:hypothetical protein